MKKINLVLLSASLALLPSMGNAQAFETLVTDVAGDAFMSGYNLPDIKSISYYITAAEDTIVFRIETHNELFTNPDGDFGLMFGFDTDLNPANGTTWLGDNTSMKYDKVLFIVQNGHMEPGVIRTAIEVAPVGGYLYDHYPIVTPDERTLIIHLPLDSINSDGELNLIVGSGFWNIYENGDVIDEAPEADYIEIRKGTTGIGDFFRPGKSFSVFPNPAKDVLHLNLAQNQKKIKMVSIFDLSGKDLGDRKLSGNNSLDIGNLHPGVYIIQVENVAQMFIKQ